MSERIIDRDIAFYEGEIEQGRKRVQRAMPGQEERDAVSLLYAARRVHNALLTYRAKLDSFELWSVPAETDEEAA